MQIPVEWGLKFFSSAKVLKIFQIAASATIKESKRWFRSWIERSYEVF